MPLNSMTGFARVDSTEEGLRWYWEIRSVNNRGLDIKLKLPQDYNFLEQQIREAISQRFTRGSISVYLNIQTVGSNYKIKVNEEILSNVLEAVGRIRKLTDTLPSTPEGLLALTGVLELEDKSQDLKLNNDIQEKILETFNNALSLLREERIKEGQRLINIVSSLLNRIKLQIDLAHSSPCRTSQAIKKRLTDQVSRILDVNSNLDASRIYQEAALLATRYDVEEEIQRLYSHIQSSREILEKENGPAGRRLDFLSQELNREANTLTSKALDFEISKVGLELKTLIDQVREQVQNIE